MGCDIHLHIEVKNGNYWEPLRRYIQIGEDLTFKTFDWMKGRNYDTFAMMANVRNYDDDRYEPIDMPRGLPKDISDYVGAESERWGTGGHSHSYFTLRELLDLEKSGYWKKTMILKGVVHITEMTPEWEALIKERNGQNLLLHGPPKEWALSIGGPPPEELFNVRWECTYEDADHGSLKTLIHDLKTVGNSWALRDIVKDKFPVVFEDGVEPFNHWVDAAELIRIVFWFDS